MNSCKRKLRDLFKVVHVVSGQDLNPSYVSPQPTSHFFVMELFY